MAEQEKQCRICFDGVDAEAELGRLIRPCLCKGSISYVHVKCLERWRKTSASRSAFFACPQCKYQYRFARTRISGLAANQIVVGGLSGLLFTVIVMIASYITTFFLEPTHSNVFFFWPFEVVDDLVRAAFRVLRDGELGIFVDDPAFMTGRAASSTPAAPPGIIKSFLRRFIIGLPLVGATSVVHMLLNAPIIGPVQWMSRWRGSRSRRNRNTQDLAALIIVGLLLIGTIRAVIKVYRLAESLTQKALVRAEDAILEVN
ncbi:hypothetical protein CPC08DRAFT_654729 [Agrocybe pediades]|nr:hypothetical protein CPC08DRAFT_654729 [Agrocybe pediades]